jgi:hypothetical protein
LGLLLALLTLASRSASAGDGLWGLSLRTQGAMDFKPGQDLWTGPEVVYSHHALLDHKLQFKAAWLTSRMEQAFRENILKYDFFLFSPLWHFRRNSLFDPTVQLDLGYGRFDVENEEIFGDLDNDTFVASFQGGLNLNFARGRWGLHYSVGYNFIAPEGHLLTPATYGLNAWMML